MRNIILRLIPHRTDAHGPCYIAGAADPQRNSEGLSTFFHPDLQTELACLLGEQGVAADCRPPDVVLFNSALHDVYHHSLTFGAVEAYERHLATLMVYC